MQPFSIDKGMEPFPRVPDDIKFSPLNRQPINTNPSFSTNFRLMIPKIRSGIYFCTEATFPSLTMEPIKLPVPFSPSLKFFGNKIDHGDLSVKFIVNDDYSNWFEMSDWFNKSLNYYGFFKNQSDVRLRNIITDSGQLLILNNKKYPVARVLFDGLMITSLVGMPMNSSVSDNSPLVCDATFQFTAYDIKEP